MAAACMKYHLSLTNITILIANGQPAFCVGPLFWSCPSVFVLTLFFLLHFSLTQFLNTGPDAPPALKSVNKRDHHDILDGPFSDLNIQGDVPQQQLDQSYEPQRTITTHRTVQYTTETRTRKTEQYPMEDQVDSREPTRPQYPIEANVEVKPASYQPQRYNQMTIEAKLETTPGGRDIIRPQQTEKLETPPTKPLHTQYGAVPQETRGGVPTRPTGPLATTGSVPYQQAAVKPEQARVEEQMVSPQNQVQEEIIAPQAVRKEESAPISLHFLEQPPAQTSPKRPLEHKPQTQSPEFVMPPMPNGTVQTPSPEHKPMQIVEEPSISVQRVKVEESSPVQVQQQMQKLEEAPITPQKVKVEETEPEQIQNQLQHLQQPQPTADSQTPTPTSTPQTPSFTDNLNKPSQPPGVMYPTFSDRHRKAGPLKVDDTPPGYKTLYDNKKGSRTSTGR